jgi:hypothetical protein
MRTFALALLPAFLAGVMAAPAPQTADCASSTCEIVSIGDLAIWSNTTAPGVLSVDFTLVGTINPDRQVVCHKTNPVLGQDVVRCSGTNYSFNLKESVGQPYALEVFHELGVGHGLTGTSDLPLICRSGGNGRTLCTLTSSPYEFHLFEA